MESLTGLDAATTPITGLTTAHQARTLAEVVNALAKPARLLLVAELAQHGPSTRRALATRLDLDITALRAHVLALKRLGVLTEDHQRVALDVQALHQLSGLIDGGSPDAHTRQVSP